MIHLTFHWKHAVTLTTNPMLNPLKLCQTSLQGFSGIEPQQA